MQTREQQTNQSVQISPSCPAPRLQGGEVPGGALPLIGLVALWSSLHPLVTPGLHVSTLCLLRPPRHHSVLRLAGCDQHLPQLEPNLTDDVIIHFCPFCPHDVEWSAHMLFITAHRTSPPPPPRLSAAPHVLQFNASHWCCVETSR